MENNNRTIYNKAIRDRIPEVIESSGKKANVEVLDAEGFKKHLDIKLGEELTEYLEDGSVEELADLVEVVYGILYCKGVSIEDFEKIRLAKVTNRGAFKKRLFLKETWKE